MRDSDSIIEAACVEAVQEMYDTDNTDHEAEIARLQALVRTYYEAEREYQETREADHPFDWSDEDCSVS